MKNLESFAITSNGNGTINNFPRFTISAIVKDPNGNVLADLTGANAINFPADIPSILNTAQERRAFVETIANFLIDKKIGGA